MTLKEAAVELLKVADQIEKDASEATQFVCAKCNHTSTLANINAKRTEVAKTAEENVTVADVTVNDKIHCPACDGVMAYNQTEASAPFYFDPEKKADDKKEEEKEMPKESAKKDDKKEEKEEEMEKKASIDYDSLQRYASK